MHGIVTLQNAIKCIILQRLKNKKKRKRVSRKLIVIGIDTFIKLLKDNLYQKLKVIFKNYFNYLFE